MSRTSCECVRYMTIMLLRWTEEDCLAQALKLLLMIDHVTVKLNQEFTESCYVTFQHL